jgi:hypothetical protein
MLNAKFYATLRREVADLVGEGIARAAEYVRQRQSPLCAFCIEYDDQGSCNVRVETESDWIKRDQTDKSYEVERDKRWLDAARDDIVARIRKGHLSAQTKCRRSGNYREFELVRFFPAEFGVDAAEVQDWAWKYRVGDFEIAATEGETLGSILQAYWADVIDNEPGFMKALEGKEEGEGESYSYVRRHIDNKFVAAVENAIRDKERAILSIDHTTDFIAFVAVAEATFTPDMIVIGDRRRFSGP